MSSSVLLYGLALWLMAATCGCIYWWGQSQGLRRRLNDAIKNNRELYNQALGLRRRHSEQMLAEQQATLQTLVPQRRYLNRWSLPDSLTLPQD